MSVMMNWRLFDERGVRVPRLTLLMGTDIVLPGWQPLVNFGGGSQPLHTFGYDPERSWRPTWFCAKMARGYRIFELDVGEVEYVDETMLTDWWVGANDDQRRVPTMAAVEMLLRHIA